MKKGDEDDDGLKILAIAIIVAAAGFLWTFIPATLIIGWDTWDKENSNFGMCAASTTGALIGVVVFMACIKLFGLSDSKENPPASEKSEGYPSLFV